MVANVEARSLSTINRLAAGPPQYPHQLETHESIVLYLSKVPGSQDLILSTFKPQRKNVTASDVANALYYIHMDTPADALESQLVEHHTPRSSMETMVRCKPLPHNSSGQGHEETKIEINAPSFPSTVHGNNHIGLIPDHRLYATSASTTEAGPGHGPNPMFQVTNLKDNRSHPLPHRPKSTTQTSLPVPDPPPPTHSIPPKPVGGGSFSQALSCPALHTPPFTPEPVSTAAIEHEFTVAHSLPAQQEPPVLPKHDNSLPSPVVPPPLVASSTSSSSGRREGGKQRRSSLTSSAFTLTIIRRDPTSGHQWNVGQVASFQTNIPIPDVADEDFETTSPHIVRQPQISVRIGTAGYAQYRGLPTPKELAAAAATMAGNAGARRGSATSTAFTQAQQSPCTHDDEMIFHRQVFMTYTESWTANIKRAFRRHNSDDSASDVPHSSLSPRHSHVREQSASSLVSVEEEERAGGQQVITYPRPGLKPRGYVFLSPWLGRCEFRTGYAGRSLKLRHVLEQSPSASCGHLNRDGFAGARMAVRVRDVSELRFNLPGPPLPKGYAMGGDLNGKFFKLMRGGGRDSDDEEGCDDDADVLFDGQEEPDATHLGREKAGGGAKGIRPKLGKLIVHEEGLKMLDLVVAANVGVWWRVWEKESAQ